MAENNDKDLAYRVLCGKTPVLDVYFDGSYKIRRDIPEEERSESAKGFHRVYKRESTIQFHEMVQSLREDSNYDGERHYSPPSDEYLKAYRTLEVFNQTPDYLDEEIDKDTEVEVFGGAEVPWGKIEDGFFSGVVSAYIKDGVIMGISF